MLHGAGLEVEHPRDQLVPARCARAPSSIQPKSSQRLLHQAQVAAAGQAEAGRFLLGHAVGDERRLADPLALAHAVDQVVLDAAAGDRAGDLAVVAHRQQGAGRARRRAPGLDDGDEPDRAALATPVAGLREHLQIEAVHCRSELVRPSRATALQHACMRHVPRCRNGKARAGRAFRSATDRQILPSTSSTTTISTIRPRPPVGP